MTLAARTSTCGAADAGPAPTPVPGRLTVEAPAAEIRLIRACGVLDRSSAARLLRLVDAELSLVRTGRHRLSGLIVDLSAVHSLERGGPETLRHARYACARLGIDLVLSGCGVDGPSQALPARTRLAEFRSFPTAGAALHALGRCGCDPTVRGLPSRGDR